MPNCSAICWISLSEKWSVWPFLSRIFSNAVPYAEALGLSEADLRHSPLSNIHYTEYLAGRDTQAEVPQSLEEFTRVIEAAFDTLAFFDTPLKDLVTDINAFSEQHRNAFLFGVKTIAHSYFRLVPLIYTADGIARFDSLKSAKADVLKFISSLSTSQLRELYTRPQVLHATSLTPLSPIYDRILTAKYTITDYRDVIARFENFRDWFLDNDIPKHTYLYLELNE